VTDCAVEPCAYPSDSDVTPPLPCEVPARTCGQVTNAGLSLLLSLPAHISAERSIVIQMSRALKDKR